MAIAHEQPAGIELSGGPPAGTSPASRAQTAQAVPDIPDYELLRRVGRGAYGEVWLARNLTGSFVAVKVVARTAFEYDRPFEREFEGIKRFEPISRSNPAQVAVLHVGRGDGFFYYVMELADDANIEAGYLILDPGPPQAISGPPGPVSEGGRSPSVQEPLLTICHPASSIRHPESYCPHTLREDLKRHGRLPVAQCVEIGLALTRALAHLHRCGLVHRDVKPSNVIFVGGVAKLADIGLVTSIDATRSLVGTEGYVAPEGPGTPQADLYSLGKLLYELSTGCDRKQFPALPPDISSRPDRMALIELNAIVMRACQFDPRERYTNANELLGELELLAHGKSVVGKRRSRKLAGVASVGSLAMAAGAILFWQMPDWPRRPRSGPLPLGAEAYKSGYSGLRRGDAEGFRQAVSGFTAVAVADPGLVAGQARLFEAYLMSEDYGVPFIEGKAEKLKELSARLSQLAPKDAETHAARAIVLFVNEWKWPEAEREFKRSLQADEGCRMALTYYGYFLSLLGRNAEARDVLQRALTLDPRSPLITKFLGHCAFGDRQFGEALRIYTHASELEPAYGGGHYWAGRVYLALTNYPRALDEFEQYAARQINPEVAQTRYAEFREIVRRDGSPGYWRRWLEIAQTNNTPSPYAYAEFYARLGEKQQALESLANAVAQHDSAEHMLLDEFWDRFRHEPGFKDAVKHAGLSPLP